MIKEIENLVVKMYRDPEPQELAKALMSIGEVPFSKEEYTETIHREPVLDNEMPIYAFYDEEDDKWVLDVENPEGLVDVMVLDDAMEIIEDLQATGKYPSLQEKMAEEERLKAEREEDKSEVTININGADALAILGLALLANAMTANK